VADVTQTTVPEALPTRPRLCWDAIALLVLAAASAGLLIAISYGFNTEYADTAASDISVAARSFVDWGIGLVVVIAFALGALAVARRSRGGRTMSLIATAVAVVTVIGVPAGAVLGMHEKFERYPDQPSCTSGFTGGPAVRVVRASQREFVELDHPGPFSGGGASGVDGCATQLMVDGTSTYRAPTGPRWPKTAGGSTGTSGALSRPRRAIRSSRRTARAAPGGCGSDPRAWGRRPGRSKG
jgi:hypothetical protein